jgi:hypothetical protein
MAEKGGEDHDKTSISNDETGELTMRMSKSTHPVSKVTTQDRGMSDGRYYNNRG